ncbi:hypothetical protein GE061_007783 [Apolygus lucorum]|uniref:Uncharacterized protein n=1 Tax=Apolygus lucorum TaxID=248454 RepID=A0A8S9WPH8_APOLU|nr:hypothetical protein GE061_007783 [Apolygus lucorum]
MNLTSNLRPAASQNSHSAASQNSRPAASPNVDAAARPELEKLNDKKVSTLPEQKRLKDLPIKTYFRIMWLKRTQHETSSKHTVVYFIGKMDLLHQLQAIDKEVQPDTRTISVKEFPLKEVYLIQDVRKVATRFGQTVVAQVKSKATGRCENVWLLRRHGETLIRREVLTPSTHDILY